MTPPQHRVARDFMARKGLTLEPFDVTQLDGQDCWYFYYRLPQGVLELEVSYDWATADWETTVTAFPVRRPHQA